jgi:acyl transferase domain-containing protein
VPKERWQPEIAVKGAQPGAAPDPASLVGGFISNFEYDWKRHKVPPKQVQQADPLQFQLLEATDQAMQDAGYDKKEFNRENVGVVVGTEFGGDFAFQLQMGLRIPELERHIEALLVKRGLSLADAKQAGKDYGEAMLKSWPALIDETGSFSTSSLASRIGKTWNMMGGAAAIDAGQSSGLAALSTSVDMLLARACDMMICAAGQRRMGWPIYESLALSGDLAKGPARSPLDAGAQGNVPGEGVVVVLLKRLADAQRDGDRIHAVLRGVGAAHDHASWGNALQMAMERSFVGSTQPSDVAVMEIDALGNTATTAEELRAVASVYGKNGRQRPLMLSSSISQIGNTQGAVSLVSLLKAILEVSHGELPPAVGMHSPSHAVTQHGNLLSAPSAKTAIELTTADGRRLAAVGTCSRGLAYHAVLEYGSRVAVNAATAAPQTTAAPSHAAIAQASAPSTVPTGAASVDTGELEQFLVNFVVEQTGYPPEVVELDADLEADLGIDSIKKAQMFGELQEYFDVTPTDNMTLDDFPTLRHIVNFLAKAPTKAGAPVSTPASISQPARAAQPASSPYAPAPIAEQVTQAVEAAMQPVASAQAATGGSAVDLAELEKFLINFVVEQTGYPPEVVELDADLEADLGIDSIKKAQMFGELQEYFDVTPTEGMTLDDFPTLRHIVTFLAKAPTKQGAPVATAAATVAPTAPPQVAPAPASAAAQAAVAVADAKPQAPPAATPAPQPAISATAEWQICRFGAADAATLRATAEAAQSDAAAFRAASQRRFAESDRFRLAIVADGAATLSARLATAVKQMENAAAQTVLEQQGIFYREANPDTRIAFLFPGQGSQYTGMLKQLVADVPAVQRQLGEIDVTMKRLGFPTWAQLAWDEASPLGKDVWTTQISMLLGDVLALSALRARGIQPDLVAGHSYGEYPALLAAGAWDLEQAARVTRHRCDSINAFPGGETGMLATTATPQTIEGLAARLSGPAFVATHNAPDQTVVGGTLAALAELEPLLQAGLFETRRLQVPSAFHTPLMREASYQFERAIAGESYLPPRIKTYSVANNEAISDPKQIGKNLVAHLTTPVRYADLIRKLASQAPTVFVEVGPQQALSRLNRKILPSQFNGIASDNPSRPGIEQIVRVQALLECTGALDRPRAAATVSKSAAAPTAPGQIWHFDATARRRDKMRAAATKGTHPAAAASRPAAPSLKPAAPQPGAPVAQEPLAPAPAPVAAAPRPPVAPAAPVAPVSAAPISAAPASTAPAHIAPASAAPAAAAPAAAVDLAELEKFLINFVVEQTGYPPEVVELDADLEADLGIDSIKKAQLFGEMRKNIY